MSFIGATILNGLVDFQIASTENHMHGVHLFAQLVGAPTPAGALSLLTGSALQSNRYNHANADYHERYTVRHFLAIVFK
jgi:hypothetical protein